MSPALIGAFVGLAFAVVEYFIFGTLIRRAEQREGRGQGLRILDLARKAQLILFPLVGFFVGSYLVPGGGVF